MVDVTEKLFIGGLDPQEIAKKRELAITTVYDHLAHLIVEGKISVDQVVPKEIRLQIEKVIKDIGSTRFLSPIKALLPDEITYEMIRCVAAIYPLQKPEISKLIIDKSNTIMSVKQIVELGKSKSPTAIPELIPALESNSGNVRRLAASALGKIRDARAVEPLLKLLEREIKPQVRQYAVKALGAIGDKRAEKALLQISGSEDEMYYTRVSAKKALKQLNMTTAFSTQPANPPDYTVQNSQCDSSILPLDDIDSFLTTDHPRPLTGPWQTGWALGFHSQISGGNFSRSGVGNLTYRLKYESDTTVLPALVQQTFDLFQAHPEMTKVDFIIPVPSTTERKINPVYLFCEAWRVKSICPCKNWLTKLGKPSRKKR